MLRNNELTVIVEREMMPRPQQIGISGSVEIFVKNSTRSFHKPVTLLVVLPQSPFLRSAQFVRYLRGYSPQTLTLGRNALGHHTANRVSQLASPIIRMQKRKLRTSVDMMKM